MPRDRQWQRDRRQLRPRGREVLPRRRALRDREPSGRAGAAPAAPGFDGRHGELLGGDRRHALDLRHGDQHRARCGGRAEDPAAGGELLGGLPLRALGDHRPALRHAPRGAAVQGPPGVATRPARQRGVRRRRHLLHRGRELLGHAAAAVRVHAVLPRGGQRRLRSAVHARPAAGRADRRLRAGLPARRRPHDLRAGGAGADSRPGYPVGNPGGAGVAGRGPGRRGRRAPGARLGHRALPRARVRRPLPHRRRPGPDGQSLRVHRALHARRDALRAGRSARRGRALLRARRIERVPCLRVGSVVRLAGAARARSGGSRACRAARQWRPAGEPARGRRRRVPGDHRDEREGQRRVPRRHCGRRSRHRRSGRGCGRSAGNRSDVGGAPSSSWERRCRTIPAPSRGRPSRSIPRSPAPPPER